MLANGPTPFLYFCLCHDVELFQYRIYVYFEKPLLVIHNITIAVCFIEKSDVSITSSDNKL